MFLTEVFNLTVVIMIYKYHINTLYAFNIHTVICQLLSQFLKSTMKSKKSLYSLGIIICFVLYPREDNTVAKNFQETKCHNISSFSFFLLFSFPFLFLFLLPFLSPSFSCTNPRTLRKHLTMVVHHCYIRSPLPKIYIPEY